MKNLRKPESVQAEPMWPRYTGQTYYGVPPLKHSHYGMKTAIGFFLQGIGSSAQIFASLGDLLDRERNRGLIRTGRAMAFLASPAGPLMFVAELHTPSRWYNMLRIFRPTSPMSIGIWTLAKMGLFNSLAAVGALLEHFGLERVGRRLDRVFGLSAAVAGGLVSFYMGSEIEETSTPVWVGAFPFLPPLIAATGFSNGAAALSLAASLNGDTGTRLRLRRIGLLSSGSQIVFAGLMSSRLQGSMGPSAVHRRAMAALWPALIFPAVLRLMGLRSRRRGLSRTAEVAALAGGAAAVATLLFAGRESGKAPQDYFRLTEKTGRRPGVAGKERPLRETRAAALRAALWGGFATAAGLAACSIVTRSRSTVEPRHPPHSHR